MSSATLCCSWPLGHFPDNYLLVWVLRLAGRLNIGHARVVLYFLKFVFCYSGQEGSKLCQSFNNILHLLRLSDEVVKRKKVERAAPWSS